MENPPYSISSFSGFPSLLEASRVTAKALSHGDGLIPQTENISAGTNTICNGDGLSHEIEDLSAKEQRRKVNPDSSSIVQLDEVSQYKGISVTHSLVNKDANIVVGQLPPIISQKSTFSYSNVLKGAHNGPIMDIPTSKPMNLKFYQPLQSGNRKCVSPPMEVAEDGSKAWKNCLVGYFIEKKLPFSFVNNIAKKIWGNYGLLEVLANEKGFYFFKFSDDDSCSKVLEAGPWLFAGRMIILKKWHSRLVLTKESYSKVPVWVKFFNIPHEYWTEEGLSYIASAVGKPLYADSLTESMKRISYARICVEIDATSKLVDSFDLLMGDCDELNNGESVEILVEYQWRPKICPECKSFGHSTATCPNLKQVVGKFEENRSSKVKQEWVKVNRGAAAHVSNSSGNLARGDATLVPSPSANMEPLPLSISSLNVDEVIATGHSEIEPHLCPTNMPIKNQCNVLSKESVVDTSNKFSALDENGYSVLSKDSVVECSDDDSPTTASPDHSLWLSKIKNIDGVPIIGLSSTPESSSNKKKKKKRSAKKGVDNSSQAKVKSFQPLND